MFFAKTCRHFDGLLGKKYAYSGFYWECEKKGCLCQNLKMYKAYNGEVLWEGEGHGECLHGDFTYYRQEVLNKWTV